jgi:hypothetical protein
MVKAPPLAPVSQRAAVKDDDPERMVIPPDTDIVTAKCGEDGPDVIPTITKSIWPTSAYQSV